jgi:hypothetical protein
MFCLTTHTTDHKYPKPMSNFTHRTEQNKTKNKKQYQKCFTHHSKIVKLDTQRLNKKIAQKLTKSTLKSSQSSN